jgi:hypothetical protein
MSCRALVTRDGHWNNNWIYWKRVYVAATNKTNIVNRSPQANYTEQRPPMIGEVSANVCI